MCDVTVLMTVYNGLPYIVEAVDSIRRQTLTDWKMVIVNDGSKDGTPAWLDVLNDPRITVIHQANGGAPNASNHGLKYIDTPLVARLDADDVANPRRLELQVAFMKAHPEVGLAGSQVAPLGTVRLGKGLSLPQTHEAIMKALMNGLHGMAHSSVIVRTDILKKIGGYWERGVAEDVDMFVRVAEHGELANLPEQLLNFRILSGSLQSLHMAEVHTRFLYIAEKARRRQTGEPYITYEDFAATRAARPWWSRAAESMEIHAMTQYRKAQSEFLGTRPTLGYARLAWAAACSPQRTINRIGRVMKHSLIGAR